jgi:hypothetical protein
MKPGHGVPNKCSHDGNFHQVLALPLSPGDGDVRRSSHRGSLADNDFTCSQAVELYVEDRIDAKPFTVMQQTVVLRMVGHHENVCSILVMAMSDHPTPVPSLRKDQSGQRPLVGMAVQASQLPAARWLRRQSRPSLHIVRILLR